MLPPRHETDGALPSVRAVGRRHRLVPDDLEDAPDPVLPLARRAAEELARGRPGRGAGPSRPFAAARLRRGPHVVHVQAQRDGRVRHGLVEFFHLALPLQLAEDALPVPVFRQDDHAPHAGVDAVTDERPGHQVLLPELVGRLERPVQLPRRPRRALDVVGRVRLDRTHGRLVDDHERAVLVDQRVVGVGGEPAGHRVDAEGRDHRPDGGLDGDTPVPPGGRHGGRPV
mmetsp:Transcript_40637/g.79489  ORF Transcript_40637/g.79489 Transcript_40637/m.79489 type:complete len:228 (+) Transcript_40637:217-900(+)